MNKKNSRDVQEKKDVQEEKLDVEKQNSDALEVVELRMDSSKEVVQVGKGGGCSWK